MAFMHGSSRNKNRGLPPRARATDRVVLRPSKSLRVHLENEAEYARKDRLELERRAALALLRGADVPARVQKGPTCGLYALGMIMDYWERLDSSATVALVQESDDYRQNSHSMAADTQDRLLDVALALGYTTRGEMLNASELAALAKHFGYQATVHDDVTLEGILRVLDAKHPTLVAFDVDDDGNPGAFGGQNAHWAVLQAHFEDDGVRYLVATHAWSGGEYVWKAEELLRSIEQLQGIDVSDFPGAQGDIAKTLRDRMIEVFR